ncbi:adenosine receptor A2b-like [Heterodontus francisci]|uniref:adenosine receptor A2b-like n=1 Tax=Heterodontus francisci TaxID=7792 RepID=UPI00355B5159
MTRNQTSQVHICRPESRGNHLGGRIPQPVNTLRNSTVNPSSPGDLPLESWWRAPVSSANVSGASNPSPPTGLTCDRSSHKTLHASSLDGSGENNALYSVLVTGRCTHRAIAVMWVLSLFLGLIPLFGWNTARSARRVCEEAGTGNGTAAAGLGMPGANASAPCELVACLFEQVVDLSFMVYCNFLACVLAPLLGMLALYAKIFAVARRQLRRLRSAGGARTLLWREVRAAKSLLLVVGLFALCWLPLHSLNAMAALCPSCGPRPLWLMDLAIVLSHANSAVNPIIYAFRLRDFRRAFLGLALRNCDPGRARLNSDLRSLKAGPPIPKEAR